MQRHLTNDIRLEQYEGQQASVREELQADPDRERELRDLVEREQRNSERHHGKPPRQARTKRTERLYLDPNDLCVRCEENWAPMDSLRCARCQALACLSRSRTAGGFPLAN